MSTVQFVAPGRPVAQQAGGGGGGGGGRGRCGRGLGGRRQQDSTRACDQVLRDSQIWHVGTLTPYNGHSRTHSEILQCGLVGDVSSSILSTKPNCPGGSNTVQGHSQMMSAERGREGVSDVVREVA